MRGDNSDHWQIFDMPQLGLNLFDLASMIDGC